jgi:hypothetical protein
MNFATRSTHTTLDLGLQKEKHKSHVNDKTLMKEARLRIFAIDYIFLFLLSENIIMHIITHGNIITLTF